MVSQGLRRNYRVMNNIHPMRFEFMGIWLHLLQSNNQPYSLFFISEEGRFVLLSPSLASMREESSNGFLALLCRDTLID